MHGNAPTPKPHQTLSRGIAQEELPQPTLADFPVLALHAAVIALRRPVSLLLPPTAVLFCTRCASQVATAALRLQESQQLNAWAGASRGGPGNRHICQFFILSSRSFHLVSTLA